MRTLLGCVLTLVPAVASAGSLTLEVSALVPGESTTFTVTGLAPDEAAWIVRGSAIAPGDCPAFLGGSCLDIVPAIPVVEVVGDAGGRGVAELVLPPSLPTDLPVALQAVVIDGAASRLSLPLERVTRLPDLDLSLPGDMIAPEVVHGAPNTDDDDSNGTDDILDGDDVTDTTPFQVIADPRASDRGVTQYELSISGDLGAVIRLDDEVLLHGSVGPVETSMPWRAEPLNLSVEFAGFNLETTLTVAEKAADGTLLDARLVTLKSSPLVLNHHLQPAEQVFVVRTRGGFLVGDNVEFVTPMADALGDLLWSVEGSTVGQDVWIQDEIEFATARSELVSQDVVIDSIRDRGLDSWPEAAFYGPDWAVHTWGSGWANTYDSFGNLETSPPVTVGETTYPFGRIYYGAEGGSRPDEDFTDFLAAQKLQAPFELDTSWLCVGHVDEFMTFIPDASAPKGFRLVWTDIPGAWEIIDALDPAMMLPRYRDHGHSTVGAFQSDARLRSYNEDIDAMYLEPMKARVMAELGLTEDDVVYIPGLFEEACGRLAAALVPGMANLVVANPEGGPSHILMADPFFRSDASDPTDDPFIAAVEAMLPAEHEPVWVDDWNDYHLLLGEVHCGTNTIRTQDLDWWTEASALDRLED